MRGGAVRLLAKQRLQGRPPRRCGAGNQQALTAHLQTAYDRQHRAGLTHRHGVNPHVERSNRRRPVQPLAPMLAIV